MRIFNIMMSRDLGGIQQSFLDYSTALKNEGDYDISDSEKEFREDLKTLCQDFIRTFNKMVKNEKI